MTEVKLNAREGRGTCRCANYELMGIIMMFFIIMGHVTMYSGKLDTLGTVDYYITNSIRSFCMMAVNVFVIRSGYFGINLKWDKILRFDLRTCFYTWLGLVIGIAFGIHQINFMQDIKLLFPVITKQYWYITAYLALCILSPYINTFLKAADRKILRSLLVTGFFLFYVMATFCFVINAEQLVMDAGYGLINFVYLYCLGYYIRNYYEDNKRTGVYLLIYVISCLFVLLGNAGLSKILGFYFNSLISYNTIFVLLASVGVFLVFQNIHVPGNKLISKLAPKTLAVYIIHMNPVLSRFIFTDLLKVNAYSGLQLIIAAIVLSTAIFLVAAVIDMVVDLILKPIEKVLCTAVAYFKTENNNKGR